MLGVVGQELQSGDGESPRLMNEGFNVVSLITGRPNHQVQFRIQQAFVSAFSSFTD